MSFFLRRNWMFRGSQRGFHPGNERGVDKIQVAVRVHCNHQLCAGNNWFVGLAVGCSLLVNETRLALRSIYEEAQLARSWFKQARRGQLLPADPIFIFCSSSRSAAGGQFSRSLL